jgi:TM2 domain-containing membrane protein YozV
MAGFVGKGLVIILIVGLLILVTYLVFKVLDAIEKNDDEWDF